MFKELIITWFTFFSISFSANFYSPSSSISSTQVLLFSLPFLAFALSILLQKQALKMRLSQDFLEPLFQFQIALFTLLAYFPFQLQNLIPIPLDTLFPNSFYFFVFSFPYLLLKFLASFESSFQERIRYVRYLLPFYLFQLFFLFCFDSFSKFENSSQSSLTFFFIGFIILSLTFFPLIIALCWTSKGLKNKALESFLLESCQKAQFHFRHFRTWDLFPNVANAAIIGLFSFSRFVFFSPLILTLPKEEIKAILIHEIGHQKCRHLFYFPLLFMIAGLFFYLVQSLFLTPFLNIMPWIWQIYFPSFSSQVFELFELLSLLVLFAICFRFIFSYFLRQFEREADSYIFSLAPSSHFLQNALMNCSKLNKVDPNLPCWHHYGIVQRIHFLKSCEEKSGLLALFQKQMATLKRSILVLLVMLSLAFVFLFSDLFVFSSHIKTLQNHYAKELELKAKKLYLFKKLDQHGINDLSYYDALKLIDTLDYYGVKNYSGLWEYYAGLILYYQKQTKASLILLKYSWEKIDLQIFKSSTFEEFRDNTLEIANSPDALKFPQLHQQLLAIVTKKAGSG